MVASFKATIDTRAVTIYGTSRVVYRIYLMQALKVYPRRVSAKLVCSAA